MYFKTSRAIAQKPYKSAITRAQGLIHKTWYAQVYVDVRGIYNNAHHVKLMSLYVCTSCTNACIKKIYVLDSS